MKSSYEVIYELIEKTPEFKMFWSDMVEKTMNANINIGNVDISIDTYYESKPATVHNTFYVNLPGEKINIYGNSFIIHTTSLINSENISLVVNSVFGQTVKTYGCIKTTVIKGTRKVNSFAGWLRIKHAEQLKALIVDLTDRIKNTHAAITHSKEFKFLEHEALLQSAINEVGKVLSKYSSLEEDDLREAFNAYLTGIVMDR